MRWLEQAQQGWEALHDKAGRGQVLSEIGRVLWNRGEYAAARQHLEEGLALAREVDLPPGYYIRYGGQFEHMERARARLMVVVPVALLLIFVLLYATYGRWLDAARVFTGVPFAAVGGIFGMWAGQDEYRAGMGGARPGG